MCNAQTPCKEKYSRFEEEKQVPFSSVKVNPVIIVGYSKLSSLLLPKHSYFEDKQASVECWRQYLCVKDNRIFAFPQLNVSSHKLNPFVLHKRAQAAGRKCVRLLSKAINNNKQLSASRLIHAVFTLPKQLSQALVNKAEAGEDFTEEVWKIFKKFFRVDLPNFYRVAKDDKLGAHVNLHTWSSSSSHEAHFHFHLLMLNQIRHKGGSFSSLPYHLGGDRLRQLKVAWSKRVLELADSLGVSLDGVIDLKGDRLANVFYSFCSIEQRARVSHLIKYAGRRYLVDFAYFAAKNPDCPDPPEWQVEYSNRARAFGWWRCLTSIIVEDRDDRDQDKERLCPQCGEVMEELQSFSLRFDIRAPPPLAARVRTKNGYRIIDVDYGLLLAAEGSW